jgi:hypothetical protein
LEDKLNYIDDGHEDIVYSLSSSLFKSHNKYVLTIFTPPKFKSMNWNIVNNNFVARSNDVYAIIAAKCSDQLWYELQYDSPLILEKYDICLN